MESIPNNKESKESILEAAYTLGADFAKGAWNNPSFIIDVKQKLEKLITKFESDNSILLNEYNEESKQNPRANFVMGVFDELDSRMAQIAISSLILG